MSAEAHIVLLVWRREELLFAAAGGVDMLQVLPIRFFNVWDGQAIITYVACKGQAMLDGRSEGLVEVITGDPAKVMWTNNSQLRGSTNWIFLKGLIMHSCQRVLICLAWACEPNGIMRVSCVNFL